MCVEHETEAVPSGIEEPKPYSECQRVKNTEEADVLLGVGNEQIKENKYFIEFTYKFV